MEKPRQEGPGGRAPALAAVLAGGFVLRLVVALRPLRFLDGVVVPDDAYLALTVARSFGRGLGPLYGLAPTGGFEPLYVLLMAPVYALFPRDPSIPIHAALVLLAVFDTAALFFIMRLVARLSASRLTPFVAGVAWAVSPYAIHTCLGALGTSIALFILAALLDTLARLERNRERVRSARVTLGLGLLFGLGTLARFDNLLLAPVIAIQYLAWFGLAPRSWWPLFRAVLTTALGVLLLCGPWLLGVRHWTGDFLPVSGAAVRYAALAAVHHRPTFDNLYRPMLEHAMGVVVRGNPVTLGLIPILFAGLAFLGARVSGREVWARLRGLLPALGFVALLLAAHVGFLFGPSEFPRSLFPVSLALLLVFAALVDLYATGLPTRGARLGFGVACVALVVAGSAVQPPFQRLFATNVEGASGNMRVAAWARSHFPDGTRIGGSHTGALGYFADNLVVVNLAGTVNRGCYEAMRRGRMLDYLRETGVRDLVLPGDPDFILRESANAKPGDLTLVGRIGDFTNPESDWYHYRVNPP